MTMKLVPRPPVGFVGRKAEFKKLSSCFETYPVISVTGMGGSGKTAFSLKFADLLLRQKKHAGKVLWIPVSPEWNEDEFKTSILQGIIDMTGNRGYSVQTDRTWQFIVQILEENSFVLFVDDFHLLGMTEDHEILSLSVRFFRNARLFLISRKRIFASGGRFNEILEISLPCLDCNESKSMLQALLAFSQEELAGIDMDSLTSRLGGHPFSIKLAASFLKRGGHSPKELLSEESVFMEKRKELILKGIWDALSEQEQDFVRALSVLREPVNGPAFLADSENEKPVLRSLLDSFLLEHDRLGNVVLHHLLRDCARERTGPKELKLFHKRAARYYIKRLSDHPLSGVEAWFHLLKAGKKDEALSALLETGRVVLREQFAKAELVYSCLVEASGMKKFKDNQELFALKASYLVRWNRYDYAMSIIEKLDEGIEKYRLLALLETARPNMKKAVEHYEKCVNCKNSNILSASFYARYAYSLFCCGDTEKSRLMLDKARNRLQASPDLFSRVTLSMAESSLLRREGKFIDALAAITGACDLMRSRDDYYELVVLLNHRAGNNIDMGMHCRIAWKLLNCQGGLAGCKIQFMPC